MDASTILLVDDDEVLGQVLRRVLTRQGYNVLNANNVLSDNQTYGSNWLKPTRVMDGRLFQFAARVDF